MKMKSGIFVMALFALLALTGCKSKETVVSSVALHSYETECLGKSMDGTQTLRVWASGRTRSDAMEQAKKKAVYDVVFSGISAGSGECNSFPVVDEANARQKYGDYFDSFFSHKGAYRKYVSTADHVKSDMQKYQGNGSQTFGIVVVVDRSALRRRFVEDNILPK